MWDEWKKSKGCVVVFFGDDVQSDWHQHTHTDTDRDTETQAMLVCGVLCVCVWSVWMSSRGCLAARQALLLLLLLMGAAAHTHTARAMGRAQQASKQASKVMRCVDGDDDKAQRVVLCVVL